MGTLSLWKKGHKDIEEIASTFCHRKRGSLKNETSRWRAILSEQYCNRVIGSFGWPNGNPM